MRTIIIGDIHGCSGALRALLEMIKPDENADRLIHDHGVAMSNRYAGPYTIVGHIALERPVWFPGEKKLVKEIPEGTWYELPPRGVICIDTGCGKGGRLTGMVVEDGKFVLESVGEWY